MKRRIGLLVFSVALALPFASFAQEPPAKEEPPKEEPAKEAPAKEEGAKPASEAAPVPAAAPAAAAAPEAPPALSACAQSLQPIADSYKKAYDDMQKWIAQVNTQTSAANESVQKLQTQIKANEDALTKAKLDGDTSKTKELTKQTKELWTELDNAKKSAASACSPVEKEASDRVKQYGDATDKALSDFKAQSK